MTSTQLYQLMTAGDPRALATVRALTSRVFAGTATSEENATHTELTRLHAGSQATGSRLQARQDLDGASAHRIRSLVRAALRSSSSSPSFSPPSSPSFSPPSPLHPFIPSSPSHPSFAGRGGGHHGGGHHGGGWGHHGGGWGRGRSPLGGTWFPWSGNSYAPGYPCYWNLFGWVCPPYYPQPYGGMF